MRTRSDVTAVDSPRGHECVTATSAGSSCEPFEKCLGKENADMAGSPSGPLRPPADTAPPLPTPGEADTTCPRWSLGSRSWTSTPLLPASPCHPWGATRGEAPQPSLTALSLGSRRTTPERKRPLPASRPGRPGSQGPRVPGLPSSLRRKLELGEEHREV